MKIIDRSLQLLSEYIRPPLEDSERKGSLSFGIAGSGSGVPLHRHGHVFAEVLYGRKRWFLFAPDEEPEFDPDASTLQWFVPLCLLCSSYDCLLKASLSVSPTTNRATAHRM
jgi:hypothetical protein